jgi:uncharacterized protein with gpF-like domain
VRKSRVNAKLLQHVKRTIITARKANPLHISVGAQVRYVSTIEHHVFHMVQEVNDKIKALFVSDEMQKHVATFDETGMDAATVGSQARILTTAFKKKFDELFGSLAKTLSQTMVQSINDSSVQSINQSLGASPLQTEAAKLTLNTKMLDPATLNILKASAAYATSFIQSIPEQYLNNVTAAVLGSIQGGNGLADLQPYLEKQGSTVTNWARNTALDQTRKTYNNLNRSRMLKIGVKRGKWLHSAGSQHPRKLHVAFDGQEYELGKGAPVGDDGGNYVQPGEEPNCRCTFTPILDDLFADNSDDETTQDSFAEEIWD